MPEYDYGINQRVIQLRKALGYSQGKFAAALSYSRSFQAGIEINHRKVTDRLIKMIALTWNASETWLRTGEGEMFADGKDPRLERIIGNFNRLDDAMQDYVMEYLDWLVQYNEERTENHP